MGKHKKDPPNSSRRNFLNQSTGVGAAIVLSRALAATGTKAAISQSAIKPFELEEVTIAELQEGMKSGKYTARSIAEMYLARIDEVDKNGPKLNSVIELNPDALAIAESLDQERKAGKTRGPLHGIPILIKDNIDTADKMQTTAGSLALAGSIAPRDSFVAERLRAGGAVILGKTNLSEWANFRSSKSTSGWSGRGGLTRNPYALDRNTSGSSSGSGVAAAANLCAAAVGTETDGSVISPSSLNSLAGIKPTLGLLGRSGIIPIAHSQDTAGPMARTVADAAALLGALTGIDPRDAATKASAGKALTDYTKFLDPNGLKGARVGVARNLFGFNERVDKLISAAVEVIKKLGAEVIDPAELPNKGKYDDSELEVLLYEFKADLNKYLAGLGPKAPVKSLKEIIEFNEKNRDRELSWFGQDIMVKAEAKGPLTELKYRQALAKNHLLSRTRGIDAALSKYRLDALIAPTDGIPWVTDPLNGDHFTGGCSTPPAVAGYPHVTIPAGYIHGLPVGISFFAGAWSEGRLIKYAYAFEQATKHRRAPRFLPTTDLTA
ncbi:MAG TPA: amidase [Blastocatellia bacterium]|nr:amidase [Blastocatellia bacterium]